MGEGFEFEVDREALQSILENRGLARTIQGTEEQGTGSKRRLVPTDAVPTNFKVRLQIVSCYLITYVFLAEI